MRRKAVSEILWKRKPEVAPWTSHAPGNKLLPLLSDAALVTLLPGYTDHDKKCRTPAPQGSQKSRDCRRPILPALRARWPSQLGMAPGLSWLPEAGGELTQGCDDPGGIKSPRPSLGLILLPLTSTHTAIDGRREYSILCPHFQLGDSDSFPGPIRTDAET